MEESDLSLSQVLELKRGAAGPVVDVDEPSVKLVVFTLGGGWYAFHGDRIKEVLPESQVYFLPGCPGSMEGVINVRGDIESVIQLRALLALPPAPAGAASRILLGQARSMRSGIRVDAVEEVLDVPESSIQAPPHTLPDHLRAIVLGILPFRGQMVTILDLDRMFADYRAGAL